MQLQIVIDVIVEGHKKIHKIVSFQYILLFVLLYLLNVQDESRQKIEIWKNFDLTRGTTILFAVLGIIALYICIVNIATLVSESMKTLQREHFHCYVNMQRYPCLLNSGWRFLTLSFPLFIFYVLSIISTIRGENDIIINKWLGVFYDSLIFLPFFALIAARLPKRYHTKDATNLFLEIWHNLFGNEKVDLETFVEKALSQPKMVKVMSEFLGISTTQKNLEMLLDSMIGSNYYYDEEKFAKLFCIFCKNNKTWFLEKYEKNKDKFYLYETTTQ